jgi:tetratricopeptide (TPR) repeat protein
MFKNSQILIGFTTVMLVPGLMLIFSACDRDAHTEVHELDHEHGVVEFEISCNEEAQEEFLEGLAHLHHMMYEQARPHFETAADVDSDCAMSHWGIAMTSFYPLWMPTPDELLERGQNAVETAKSIGADTEREQGFISAVEAFFTDPEPALESAAEDHAARLEAWTDAQRELHERYSDDVDAAAFYALAVISYAQTQFSPHEERDFTPNQRAGELMERFFEDHPQHPGLFHYLIHAYDSPQLAHKAVEAARGYDQIAPDTPHALHMPSHIFVRLGQWEETTDWNERSAEAALRHAEDDGHAKMHYVHALDYMMYGFLQLGDEEKAAETLERVLEVEHVPGDFASGYGVAAPQARFYLEQHKWEEAARLEIGYPDIMDWDQHPNALALFAYARGLGAAHTGDLEQAAAEYDRITGYVEELRDAGDSYWAYMTEALGKAVGAQILYEQGETDEALAQMKAAADLEDSMDKHPISPGEVYPVRELYGELLLREGQVEDAIEAFEQSLQRTPNRRNALNRIDEVIAVR